MANSIFGWDLLYRSVKSNIKTNQDILVCLAHLVLISSGFKCIGLGESKNMDGSETKSESLPKNWNEHYSIRYVYQGRLYNFKATSLDDSVMIHLLRVDERSISLVQLSSRSVAQKTGTLDEMIPDNNDIIDLIKKQLIEKLVLSNKSRNVFIQTEKQDEAPTTSFSPDERIPIPALIGPALPYANIGPVNPSNYGRSDLDPLGGIDPNLSNRIFPTADGGGMLFQLPGPSLPGGNIGVPPGSLPPGARFDPFRPPDADGLFPISPNRPDSDEFPPPEYDDMFH